mgnify:CR=1 FL=1
MCKLATNYTYITHYCIIISPYKKKYFAYNTLENNIFKLT